MADVNHMAVHTEGQWSAEEEQELARVVSDREYRAVSARQPAGQHSAVEHRGRPRRQRLWLSMAVAVRRAAWASGGRLRGKPAAAGLPDLEPGRAGSGQGALRRSYSNPSWSAALNPVACRRRWGLCGATGMCRTTALPLWQPI